MKQLKKILAVILSFIIFSYVIYLTSRNNVTVTIKNGEVLLLSNYLGGESRGVSELSNIVSLFTERPDIFVRFILKSMPHTAEEIESNLQEYYREIIKFENLIESLPLANNPYQKLAGILVELASWEQVETQVWVQVYAQVIFQIREQVEYHASNQIGAQIREQIEDYARNQIGAQIREQVGNRARKQVLEQLREKVGDDVWEHVREQVGDYVWEQVRGKIWEKATDDLRNFQFASAFEQLNLNAVAKPAIDYTFTVYQLGTLAHYEEFKSTQIHLSNLLSERITEYQVSAIIDNLKLPDNLDGNYLLETQLKLIARHLL